MITRQRLVLVGAAGVLVSAYMHFYLYFWGGYRGISIDRIAGIDISRSFALNAIAGLVIAELLVLSLRFDRLSKPAAVLGVLYALGAIGGYALAQDCSGSPRTAGRPRPSSPRRRRSSRSSRSAPTCSSPCGRPRPTPPR